MVGVQIESEFVINPNSSGITAKMEEDWGGEYVVGYEAIHAPFVEFGTNPRRKLPPIDPIHGWVRRKLGLPDPEARSVAWAIAKTIKKSGTRPQPFLRPAIDDGKARIQEFLDREMVLEDLVEFIFGRSQDRIIEQGVPDEGTLLKSGRWTQIE